MKRIHPSPALVISLIALFVALGGTSYAAIASLPANSVGTKALKNGAVTKAKLNAAVLAKYVHLGGTLPSGATEVGDWGFGTVGGTGTVATKGQSIVTFPVPLASVLDNAHAVAVAGASATHCPGVGAADPGYLCVYQGYNNLANDIEDYNIYNPESDPAPLGTGKYGFAITLSAVNPQTEWAITGTYAVTAP